LHWALAIQLRHRRSISRAFQMALFNQSRLCVIGAPQLHRWLHRFDPKV
jgi:hypothetical protein